MLKSRHILIYELLREILYLLHNRKEKYPRQEEEPLDALCSEIDQEGGIATATRLQNAKLWSTAAISLREAQTAAHRSDDIKELDRKIHEELLDLAAAYPDLSSAFHKFFKRQPLL